MADWVEVTGDGVRMRVRVQPRASRTEVAGVLAGALKIRLAAPPVEGEANDALLRFLAKRLDVARSALRIASGERGRLKAIDVSGISVTAARRLLSGGD